jgi:pre-mRNA-splicing helicase BRR2
LTLFCATLCALQVLIFVHSRKETAKTALYLKQTALDNDHLAKFMRDDSASREILQVRTLDAVSWVAYLLFGYGTWVCA